MPRRGLHGSLIGGTDYTIAVSSTSASVWGSWNSNLWTSWVNNSATTSYTNSSSSCKITLDPTWYAWATNVATITQQFGVVVPSREILVADGEKEAAKAKAELILRECLNEQQRHELDTSNHFHLETVQPDGSRRKYRIQRGRSGNVKLINEAGRVIRSFCIHPVEQVPDADTMLMQKLYLETSEAEFLRVANHTAVG